MSAAASRQFISFGPFEFDAVSGLLYRGQQEILLPLRAGKVLEVFLRKPGEVLSKEDLLEEVWKEAFVGEDSLTQAISMIRSALGDDPRDPTYIQTMPKRGYRFIAEVRTVPDAEEERAVELVEAASSEAGIGVGTSLGHYEILSELGAGAMGVVYRARDTVLEREVAIKVLPEDFLSDPGRVARFEREAKLLAAVSHQNIAAIHSLEEERGTKFPVMELVEGETLEQRLQSGPIKVDEALQISRQIASALEAAHERGIIHRDLKPANIKLTPAGQVKVLDFGLAKALKVELFGAGVSDSPTESMTIMGSRRGSIVGTAAYMSPEQARGQEADKRADIWAFGCVLYEMLTGRRPFRGDTVSDTIAGVLEREPDWEALPAETPRATRRVLRRCLTKDSQDRLRDIADARIEIDEASRPERTFSSVGTPLGSRPRKAFMATVGTLATVAALLVVLVGMNVGDLRDRLLGTGRGSIQSLAVLPLENLMGDPEQDYLVEGMQEELISELQKISALKVISRTSTLQYKGTEKSVPEIAQELDVEGVIEGSMLQEGDDVRITVRLIDGPSERPLWANTFNRELRGILALHSEVARAIADEIRLELSPQEQTLLASARPVDPEAYDAYVRGRYFANRWPAPESVRCIEHFQQAIDKDPDYADAYAGLASCYVVLPWLGHQSSEVVFPRAKAAAEQALQLDPNQGEAHAALGTVNLYFEWDWEEAGQNLHRALELAPNSTTAHVLSASYLMVLGRFEDAIREAEKALVLDPVSVRVNRRLAFLYMLSRRYGDYAAQSRAILQLAPDNAFAKFDLAWAYALQGMREEALAAHDEEAFWPGGGILVLATLGERERAQQSFEQWVEQLKQQTGEQYREPLWVAVVYAAMGETDAALQWLEQAYKERCASMITLKSNPGLDPLRDDPRFQDLLRRMNFPE